MNTPPKNPAEQTPTSDQKQHSVQKPTSDQTPSSARTPLKGDTRAPAGSSQIKAMIRDNDERLWYITKFGNDKFPTEKLVTLIEVRKGFQNNADYQLSAEREVQYREATMAASAFLEDRHPEAIRLYAQVQNKLRSNPLKVWLWGIGVALILALASNGYQTLIGKQVQKMKETRALYIEESSRLPLRDTVLPASLSRMCEQTLIYRAAAAQLRALLHPLTGSGGSATDRPGVCKVIAQQKIEVVAETGVKDAQVEFSTNTNGHVIDAVRSEAQQQVKLVATAGGTDAQKESLIEAARRAEFAPSEDRAVRLKAELYDSILALAIMPMLYALLGALTSAVRTASSEFKSMTLTRIDGIGLGARVLLGVVGGATIGIVFSANNLEGAAGLTVLGLAFATGYAVDLFFNLLDGIKIGLGGSTKASPQSS